MANTLKIEIQVDDKGTATITNFADKAATSLDKIKASGVQLEAGFAKTWAGIATGANMAIQAFQQLAQVAQVPIQEFMKAETASVKLGLAMKNQGDYTRESLAGMEAYAEQIQRTTAYEDDHVKSLMGNLKTYGMTNEEVKRATKIALDFTTAKEAEGMTVERASELLGKAYAGNVTALKKVGIVIDENIPKSQRYEEVLKQLNARFGGAAQAELETYAGQWKQLKNEMGDIAEVIGIGMLKAIEATMFAFSMMGAGFYKVVELILQGWGEIIGGAEKLSKFVGLESVGSGLEKVASGLKAGAQNAKEAGDAAIVMADKNYKAMVSFDNIDNAITKTGITGKRMVRQFQEDAKTQKDILASLTAANKAHYEERISASDHWLKMSKLGSHDDLTNTSEVIDKKKEYLNDWYNAQVKIIQQSGIKESEQKAKLEYLWLEYNKTWIGLVNERELAAAEITKKSTDDAVDAMEKEIELGVKLTMTSINKIKERDAAARDLYKGMRGYEDEYYDESIKLIEEKAVAYRALGLEEDAILQMVEEETIKADIAKGKSGDDFFAGMQAGYDNMLQNATTFGEIGYEIFDTFAKSSQKVVSDVLFQAIKTGTVDVTTVWNTFADTMLRKFTDTIAQMIVESTTKSIILWFKSSWVDGGSSVINLVSSVLNWANSGVQNINTGGGGGGEELGGSVPSIEMARGGYVPGYAYGGDSHINDTVHALLSPGEFVVPRSIMQSLASQGRYGDSMLAHINPGEAKLLKMMGGSGTINPSTGLPEYWNLFTFVKNAILAPWTGIQGSIKALQSGNLSNIFEFIIDPLGSINALAYAINEEFPASITQYGPLIGGVIGQIVAGAWGAAAGSGFGSKVAGANNQTAQTNAALAFVASYLTSGGEVSGGTAYSGGTITEGVKAAGVKLATKYMVGKALSVLFPYENGKLSLSFEGTTDGGLLETLGKLQGNIAPKDDKFSFSAWAGLDYVPRDNFRANLHEGEAVLSKPDAKEWRSGDNGDVIIQINIESFVGSPDTINNLAEQIGDRLQKLTKYGYYRWQ